MCVCSGVNAETINTAITTDYVMNDNTIIASGGALTGAVVDVSGAWTIQNYGTITSELHICDGCHVRIENAGVYNAAVTLGANATLTQVISNASDVTELTNVGVGYGVLIDAGEILNWDDIKTKTSGATKYTLASSQIRMDDVSTFNKPVVITGNVLVYSNDDIVADTVLFSNATGGGTVRMLSENTNPLYMLETYNPGGMIIVRSVRSYDYGRMMGNERGRFLNALREKSPNDKLLGHLDDADNMDEFNRIMSHSVRLHPIKLMQSVRTTYSHKMLEIMHIDRSYDFGIMPLSIFSNNLRLMGIEPNANIKIDDDLQIKLSANISSLHYADSINEYGGMSVGVGADMLYDLSENNFMRVYGGFNWTSFDTGLVFDGSGKSENPRGLSGFVAGEFGHKFVIDDDLYVLPFVMAGADYAHILNSNSFDMYAGVGSDVGFMFEFDGMRYGYSIRGMARSDMGMGADIAMSVWSIVDTIGADVRFGAFYDNQIGLSYRVSINAKASF